MGRSHTSEHREQDSVRPEQVDVKVHMRHDISLAPGVRHGFHARSCAAGACDLAGKLVMSVLFCATSVLITGMILDTPLLPRGTGES